MDLKKTLIGLATGLIAILNVQAQTIDQNIQGPENAPIDKAVLLLFEEQLEADSISYTPKYESLTDSLLSEVTDVDTMVNFQPFPRQFFLPAVYVHYDMDLGHAKMEPDYSNNPALRWVEDNAALEQRQRRILQSVAMQYPGSIKYNIDMLPEAPKQYDVIIDPEHYKINIVEHVNQAEIATTLVADEVVKKHWLQAFNGNLQFSQAYVSPNWYQGGNNNLNMLLNLNYNIKLNQKFHPNLLFETNVQYKLGLYSTPEDSIRSYNISEDLFQVNSTFGIKAVKKWYYTVTAQFKTQLFDSYTSNTRNLRAALLSPGELNVGVGMTYNTSNAKKTFTFDASINPISYNLVMCLDHRMNEKGFGIDEGKQFRSKYGSSVETKLGLQIAKNISLKSRLFVFTDYDRAYGDLENTVVFEINKYLTTQIFVHLRYDTNTPFVEPEWHKLQIKEILSMGFTYKFSTI